MIDLIRKLVECYGPSGHEDQIRTLILNEIQDLADEIEVDALGNVIAWRRSGSKDAPRIMFSSHMDEIGVMVTHVDAAGFLRFTNIGGLIPTTLHGNRVRFADGTVGVLSAEMKGFDRSKSPDLDHFFIDVSTGEDPHNIRPGDAAGFDRGLEVRGDHLVAKSMDDRIACAIQIEAMRRLGTPASDVAFVFSVQEEVGIRGAMTAAFGVDPHLGIALDVTRTGDTAGDIDMAVELGKGPAIKIMDSGMISAPEVVDLLEAAAARLKLPAQREVLRAGTTDARSIQTARAGVPTGCISIPCRFIHTTSETVSYRDVQACVALVTEVCEKPFEL